jgi:hypothetical protein
VPRNHRPDLDGVIGERPGRADVTDRFAAQVSPFIYIPYRAGDTLRGDISGFCQPEPAPADSPSLKKSSRG